MSKIQVESKQALVETFMFSFLPVYQAGKKGSTRDCLMHLKEDAQKAGLLSLIIRVLAEYMGVTKRAVRYWLGGDRFPSGINLFRVRYFLDRKYDVFEIDSLNPNVRLLLEFIIFDKISVNRAIKELGLPDENALWSVFDGSLDDYDEAKKKIVPLVITLWEESNDRVRQAQEELELELNSSEIV